MRSRKYTYDLRYEAYYSVHLYFKGKPHVAASLPNEVVAVPPPQQDNKFHA
jgi:hypothetical protein